MGGGSSSVPVTQSPDESERFTALVVELVEGIGRWNETALRAVIDALFATIQGGGLIHVAASGHGLALVLETFYRAGGLACVDPIWEVDLLPLAGARASTVAERMTGRGAALAARAAIRPGDCVVVFSQSGVNPVPIDLALAARAAGATVVAITSRAHGAAVPSRDPGGRRLVEVADIVIDTRVPPGDAVFRAAPDAPAVAPLSTIAGVHAWNLALVGLAERARAAGVELPVWTSANVPGGDERNSRLLAVFADRVPAL